MLCERCNKKKAVIFYRENISGRTRALRLCAECTEILEKAGELEDMSAVLSCFASPFLQATSSAAEGMGLWLGSARAVESPDKCPLCGVSLREIATTGQVGCARCYEVFGEALEEVIRSTHGKAEHLGRVSASYRVRQEKSERIRTLKAKLSEAVAGEQYETAAGLRDEIRTLEAEL